MQVLKKNAFLLGLEELYKKYGINVVYAGRPGTDTYQNNEFYLKSETPVHVLEEIENYVSTADDSLFGMYMDKHFGSVNDLVPYYTFGKFYGEVSNAD